MTRRTLRTGGGRTCRTGISDRQLLRLAIELLPRGRSDDSRWSVPAAGDWRRRPRSGSINLEWMQMQRLTSRRRLPRTAAALFLALTFLGAQRPLAVVQSVALGATPAESEGRFS